MFSILVSAWNGAKSGWSRFNDFIMGGAARRPIPTFAAPVFVWNYLRERCVYTGDPFGGAADFYLHPERLQAAMEHSHDAVRALSVDCDDYASWAYAALSKIPNCQPQLITLFDARITGSHVICTFRWNLRCGVIDTNGYRELPDLEPATLCRVFNEIYASRGYQYVQAVPTAYPFA